MLISADDIEFENVGNRPIRQRALLTVLGDVDEMTGG